MDNHDAKLLVVDDTADDRRALTMLLELEGYANVTTAKGGFEALELLQVHFFDLVFLDVMMPGVSGCQILEQLQTEGKLTNLPVIVTSEIGEFESAMHCITLGAEACLLKPVNPLLLKDKMNSSLERKFLRDRLNARLARIETELDDARQLQLSMMPAVFPLPPLGNGPSIFSELRSPRASWAAIFMISTTVMMVGCASSLAMCRTKACQRRYSWRAPRMSSVWFPPFFDLRS